MTYPWETEVDEKRIIIDNKQRPEVRFSACKDPYMICFTFHPETVTLSEVDLDGELCIALEDSETGVTQGLRIDMEGAQKFAEELLRFIAQSNQKKRERE